VWWLIKGVGIIVLITIGFWVAEVVFQKWGALIAAAKKRAQEEDR
jgi:hypothetical protein